MAFNASADTSLASINLQAVLNIQLPISLQLYQSIVKQPKQALSFYEFMDSALYQANLGYYNNAYTQLNKDFVTAPMLSPLFGQTIANCITQDTILEIGAGHGHLAAQLIQAKQPKHYFILERSLHLQSLQKDYLNSLKIDLKHVSWLTTLPSHFEGCIIGNEVLDAIGVQTWTYKNKQWHERLVGLQPDIALLTDSLNTLKNFLQVDDLENLNLDTLTILVDSMINNNYQENTQENNYHLKQTLQTLNQALNNLFAWCLDDACNENNLPEQLKHLNFEAFANANIESYLQNNLVKSTDEAVQKNELYGIYHTETHSTMQAFIKTMCACLSPSKGQMIWLDYGYLAHEYYHVQRNEGTLVTYLAHKVYYDLHAPLRNIGLQDISAHVDFSCVLDTLEACGMQIDYFANQNHFLMDHGLLNLAAQAQSQGNTQALKGLQMLLAESEMGSLVKVVVAKR